MELSIGTKDKANNLKSSTANIVNVLGWATDEQKSRSQIQSPEGLIRVLCMT